MVSHRTVEHLPGFTISGQEPAHLTVVAVVSGPIGPELLREVEELGGRSQARTDGSVIAELPEVVPAIGWALAALEASPIDRAAVHMGRVTANEDAVGGHAGRVAAALVAIAEPGAALITGGVIVEMGDEGFERFATGSMGVAELDGTSYAVYAVRRR